MSYIHMDHAGWVESSIAASKRQKPTARDKRNAAQHKGWFAAPDQLNPFQRRAFDILGIIGGGIYNAPIGWDGLIWHPKFIICTWRKGFGTFDFSDLTRFVFLCHEARIRGHIGPSGPGLLEVALHERSADGAFSQRHPNLDEAIAEWRASFPIDHPIVYCDKPIPEPAESFDPVQAATGGVLIPSMVAEQSGEQEAGEMPVASASAAADPALPAPVEPAAVEVGCGQAPETSSEGRA